MRMSYGVEWGVHVCTVLATLPSDGALPAAKLAEYHDVPAAYLAKHLQTLARAGVLETTKGPKGGYRLARPPAEITLLEIVDAIDGGEPAFQCTEIRKRGPVALPAKDYSKLCGINRAFLKADKAWRAELRNTTVADVLMGVLRDVPRAGLEKGARWIQDSVRAPS
jgi:Rrf2 family protein